MLTPEEQAHRPVERGLSDEAEVMTYVSGECHYFALALNELTGLNPVYIANRLTDGSTAVGHVAVDLGSGLLADAEGVWRTDDLKDYWSASVVQPATPADILRALGDGKPVSDHVKERIARAKRLLEGEERDYLIRLRELAQVAVPAVRP